MAVQTQPPQASETHHMSDLTRREFVVLTVAATACACSGVPAFARSSGTLDAGDPTKLPEGFTDTFAKEESIMLVRRGRTVYALSAVCTHKACTLRIAPPPTSEDGGKPPSPQLRCPCHNSHFDLEGTPIRPPAKDALCRYGVTLKDGRLIVDLNAILLPGDFEQPNASVTLP